MNVISSHYAIENVTFWRLLVHESGAIERYDKFFLQVIKEKGAVNTQG